MYKKFIPPLPFLAILAIFLVEILVWFKFKGDFTKPGSGIVLLVQILGILAAFIIYKKYTSPLPACSLFYGPVRKERYDVKGNFIRYEDDNEKCGRKSIGKVNVFSERRGGSTEHFCGGHSPENGWMKKWLERQGIKIYPETIKVFPRIDDDDEGGPDLTLRFL